MMNLNNNDTLIIDNSSHSFDTNTSHPTPRPFINLDDEYNSLIYTSDDQSDYLKIGLHTSHTHNNIQIINHPDNKSKLYIIHDTNGEHKGTGVSIILSKKLFKHFITCTFLNGRLLHITLKFKPHISLNIIAAYLPANPSSNHHHNSRSIYYTKLSQIINSIISSNKSHTIILGDFNTDLDSINNRSSIDPNFKLIKLLRNFQFYDLSEHYNLSQDKPPITHHSHRIDGIFCSPQTIQTTIHSNTVSIPSSFFTTDHKIVYSFLYTNSFIKSKHSRSKSQNNSQTRTYIPYKHLSAKCWKPYKEASKFAFD
ncbi:hypothetical protein GLOIN_2v1475603 [Rhizophagus clarus]|uniref:Endonuclease/exonuclease/phosphatase domain-containing protein n=1 Tax=Rhizophagus clarus TaxID=94130 RepID=A0A8H3QKC3_9GLOM|nr:hypothetical protein GLOIN_2v1475603 [Rhizophagus clarus]